jgi:predicted phage terminase large subunit-like protein
MPELRVTLPALHSGQLQIAEHPARFKVAACGRRWGKTRLGARCVIETALSGGIAWWVAPSYPIARVGWRTVKALAAQIPGAETFEAERIITMPGGGWLQVRSADDPDSLRGEGLDLCVLDECAFMRPAAWTEAIRPALSDRRGKALFLSTPSGRNWFFDLFKRGLDGADDYASWHLPTRDNPYIDPEEIAAARRDLTARVFRQEFEADFLADPEGALWKRDQILHGSPPDLARVVVAIDPAVTSSEGADETGIIVAGKGIDGRGYILADQSCRLSPDGWASRAVAAFDHHQADRIVAEVNNGGDLVLAVLTTVRPGISYTAVHASRGKAIRAEPIAALYEQGRITHCEAFPELEDQLCGWTSDSGKSPDRMDALVWALTELMLSPVVDPEFDAVASLDLQPYQPYARERPAYAGGGEYRGRREPGNW